MKKLIGSLLPKIFGTYFNIAVCFSPKKIARKAFLLFCTPRKGRVLAEQKSFLVNAKDHLIDFDENTLQTYRWHGKGPTVLLMHGWESNTFRWRNLIAELQKENYNIVAFDAPAHGYSSGGILHVPIYADAAQKVIKTYNPTFIIGHSVGGMTMVYNHYKYNNPNIKKMVSLGAPSELSDFMRQYRSILGLSAYMMTQLESYFVRTLHFKFSDFSCSLFAKSITIPGLIIHDELDAIAPFWCSEQVHAAWKNSTLISTKGLGHSLHQDKVRQHIIDFLKS